MCHRTTLSRAAIFAIMILFADTARAHEGPDPLGHWRFQPEFVQGSKLLARLGPDGTIQGDVAKLAEDPLSYRFSGSSAHVMLGKDLSALRPHLPETMMTVVGVFSVEERQTWGAVVGCIQDNGGAEEGWLLGYNAKNFYFGLSTEGADDGDGLLTYLAGKTRYESGKLYHVVATYDGQEMKLFVNGKLDGSSKVQSGKIHYPEQAPFVLGAYLDDNENNAHQGRIAEIGCLRPGSNAQMDPAGL